MSPPEVTDVGEGYVMQGSGVSLVATPSPWDTAVCGRPVLQIETFEVNDPAAASDELASFGEWLCAQGIGMVSCRLAEHRLVESMALEAIGFRFVEMVLHPYKDLNPAAPVEDAIGIAAATAWELPELERIARTAFRHERFHVDHRLDPAWGDERYVRWVRSSLGHPNQRLLSVFLGERTLGLFVVTHTPDGVCDWLLTAIAPDCQGQGLGKRVWQAMLRREAAAGTRRVRTTIAARNSRVLGLYAALDFRFAAPEMTFHWVAQ